MVLCVACSFTRDVDLNAARNILRKSLAGGELFNLRYWQGMHWLCLVTCCGFPAAFSFSQKTIDLRTPVLLRSGHDCSENKGFRFKTVQLRPQVNRVKYAAHPWFRELSQNAGKGGMMDAVDAIERYYLGQNRRPR